MYQENASATGTNQHWQPETPQGVPQTPSQQGPQQPPTGETACASCQGEGEHAECSGTSAQYAESCGAAPTASCGGHEEQDSCSSESGGEGGYGYRYGYDPTAPCGCDTEAQAAQGGPQAPVMTGPYQQQQPASGTTGSHNAYAAPQQAYSHQAPAQPAAPAFNPGQGGYYGSSPQSSGSCGGQQPQQQGPFPGAQSPFPGTQSPFPGTQGPFPGAQQGGPFMGQPQGPAQGYQQPGPFPGAQQGAPFIGQPQGPAPQQGSHCCDHGHESGPTQRKHDAHQFGQLMGLMNDIASGNADPSRVMSYLSSLDTQFWKGAIVGIAATMLLTNDAVKSTLAGAFAGVMGSGDKDKKEDAAE